MIQAICNFYHITPEQFYLQFFIGFNIGILYGVFKEYNLIHTAYCNYRWCLTFRQLMNTNPEYNQAFWNSLSKQHNRSRI